MLLTTSSSHRSKLATASSKIETSKPSTISPTRLQPASFRNGFVFQLHLKKGRLGSFRKSEHPRAASAVRSAKIRLGAILASFRENAHRHSIGFVSQNRRFADLSKWR